MGGNTFIIIIILLLDRRHLIAYMNKINMLENDKMERKELLNKMFM